jgi:hypothetical protein
MIVLWRAALRIQEALALAETDLDANRCSVLVQHGKGGHGHEVGMDMWAWGALRPWLSERAQLPVGPLFCLIDGATPGVRAWSSAAVRAEPPARRRCWRPPPVRATPAPPCARRRARPRRSAATDPAATARAPEYGDHQHVSVGDRRCRGDCDGRLAPGADDVGHRRTPNLKQDGPTGAGARAAPAPGARNAPSRRLLEANTDSARSQQREPGRARRRLLLRRACGIGQRSADRQLGGLNHQQALIGVAVASR